ncbi:MAG: hypothetical protein NZ733_04555 [Aigarchaeota archaeon]|nr:hypothetical protein [Aigarchaeota archaeon]
MSVKVTQEDVQRALDELAVLEQVIPDLQARVTALSASILDHERALQLIDFLTSNPGEHKVLLSIGGGSLLETEIGFKGRLKVGIGQNVVLDAPVERCRQIISERKSLLERNRGQLAQLLSSYTERAELLRRFLLSVQQAIASRGAAREGSGGAGGT